MASTYRSHGGAEREEVITELWEMLVARHRDGLHLGREDLTRAADRINPGWFDDEDSLTGALSGRAYTAVMKAVETISKQVGGESPVNESDLQSLQEAWELHRAIEALDRDSLLTSH